MVSHGDDVIIVDRLSKKFGDLTAVNDVSFSVRTGEIFGILGPNGAGKTTIMECIEGIQHPTSGNTTVLGMDTQQRSSQVKERIGVQLQASAYFDYLTLTEILKLFGQFYKQSVQPSVLLSEVELSDKADSTVDKLSGGQKQRFTIAATLVNDPEVVFLDEPTTGLDPQARRNLWDFIKRINSKGRTVVLTTHYMEEAEFLCHRIAIMDQGRIVAMDTPAGLISQLPMPYEVKVVADSNGHADSLAALAAVKEVSYDDDGTIRLRSTDASSTLPALMNWASSSDVHLTHLEVVPANLEDVFLSLTGRGLRD